MLSIAHFFINNRTIFHLKEIHHVSTQRFHRTNDRSSKLIEASIKVDSSSDKLEFLPRTIRSSIQQGDTGGNPATCDADVETYLILNWVKNLGTDEVTIQHRLKTPKHDLDHESTEDKRDLK